jgi:hypothetical protein
VSLDPPFPVYLFNVVAGLRDKSAKGYPIKKLLLLLWKTLLACWGGMKDHDRVKKVARELAGLPNYDGGSCPFLPSREASFDSINRLISLITNNLLCAADKIKTTPIDIETFRQEMAVKYPTFAPPAQPPPSLIHTPIARVANPANLTRRLSEAYSPIPIRHHYHHDHPDPEPPLPLSQQSSQGSFGGGPFGQQGAFGRGPQPPTPVPSPTPPGPKPKKQAYQTDQNRPFLFPFSKSSIRDSAKLVPFAIDEADKLYNKHMYVSLSLAQMWRTREDCMSSESGLERMPGTEGEMRSSTFNPDEVENGEPLPDVKVLQEKIEEAERMVREAQSPAEKRKAMERKEDLLRLLRVEQIYVGDNSPWCGFSLTSSCYDRTPSSQSFLLGFLSSSSSSSPPSPPTQRTSPYLNHPHRQCSLLPSWVRVSINMLI